jgi:hypothetical protein
MSGKAQTTNRTGCPVPPCPNCGSDPAANGNVDDICPKCRESTYSCGLISHSPLREGAELIRQQVRNPHWIQLPPSQVRARKERNAAAPQADQAGSQPLPNHDATQPSADSSSDVYFHAIWPMYEDDFYAAPGADWQSVREVSCRLFHRDHFDKRTMQRLNDWLLTECNDDEQAWQFLLFGDVVRMLRKALDSQFDLDGYVKQGIERQTQADEIAAKKKADLDRMEPLANAVKVFHDAMPWRHESKIDRCYVAPPEQLESIVKEFITLGRALTNHIGGQSLAEILTADPEHKTKLFACELYRLSTAGEEAKLRLALEGLFKLPVIDQADIWKQVGWLLDSFLPDWYKLEMRPAKGESETTPACTPASPTTGKPEPQLADDPPPAPAIDPADPEKPVPLSRLALPRIVEAIEELHRAIENPPTTTWQPPAWLVEQYKQTTAGKLPLKVGEKPNHAWLIGCASDEVLNMLTPPLGHRKDDCPEITESSLDQRDKVRLIELRKQLLKPFFGQTLADNRSEALQARDFLESVLKNLTGEGDDGGRKTNQAKPRRAGKTPFDKSEVHRDKLKLQIYERIQGERKAGLRPAKILEKLKADKDFMAQVNEAGLVMGQRLIKAAFAFFLQPKRKKKESESS